MTPSSRSSLIPEASDLVLFTSNCYGEDRSAALIALELRKLLAEQTNSAWAVCGASLASEGLDYKNRDIPLLHASAVPPSGGFPTRSLTGFFKDLFSNSIGELVRYHRSIKAERERIRFAFVVGDVFLLWMTRRALGPEIPLIFLSLPKSDNIEPHYGLELRYIRKEASFFFTRDELTCRSIEKRGYKAHYLGNPIMDGLVSGPPTLPLNNEKPLVVIMPGSREEAYANLALCLKAASLACMQGGAEYAAALPNSLKPQEVRSVLKRDGWNIEALGEHLWAHAGNCRVLLAYGAFNELVNRADVVLALAGTANEQAAGLGKPVVAFKGIGPQTTEARFREQQKLLGGAMVYVEDYPAGVVKELLFLLSSPKERARRGNLGRLAMGESGASRRLAEFAMDMMVK